MKKKATLLFSTIILLVGLGLLVSSCKKDEDDSNTNPSSNFSVRFADGYGYDYAWVVLHNLEGTEVIDYKKIEGDGIANFGEISGGKVTVTTIRIDTSSYVIGYDRRYIYIASDYYCPSGNWVFKGANYSDDLLGTADITLTYPASNYNEYYWATSDNWDYSDEVPYDQIQGNDNVYRLDDGDKYAIYGAVIQDDEGYCNWQLDQSFQLGQNNYYNLELTEPLDKITFVSSKPLDRFHIDGCWNQRISNLGLYYKNHWDAAPYGETYHNAYLPANMPFSCLMFSADYYDEYFGYYYCKFFDTPQGLPDIMELPDKTITAVYNEGSDEITNIQIDGTVDQLYGLWYYKDYIDTNYITINWYVYANWDRPSIKRPVLPQEIIDDIGYGIDIMEAKRISLLDYNNTSNQSDIIRWLFIVDAPTYQQNYDEICSYYYYFNPNKSQDFDKMDAERNKAQRHNYRHRKLIEHSKE
jgi:hypothetical protein